MILAQTLQEALRTRAARTLRTGDAAWVSVVIGPRFGEAPAFMPAPQVFLVEQSPHSQVPPHFHNQNQFQVVIAGEGHIGRHAVEAFSVHYAQGHTGYGPVVAGPAGLSYLSIRAHAEWLTHYLPESRPLLRPGMRENLFAPRFVAADVAALMALVQPARQPLFASEDGQALAMVQQLPPHHALLLDPAEDGGAQGAWCLLVTAGSLLRTGESFAALSCLFVAQRGAETVDMGTAETHLPLQAGGAGAQVLCMRLPFMSPQQDIHGAGS